MASRNLFPFLEQVLSLDLVTPEIFERIMNDYNLSTSDYEKMEGNEEEQLRVSEVISENFLHKDNKKFHTITSKDDFSNLIKEGGEGQVNVIAYSPLNNHSRNNLSIGDVLFSYRSGQFSDLNLALNTRGIYGVGIAITNPLKLYNQYAEGDREEYKDYGVIVVYPCLLETHLSVRSIQLHPETIDLTPYNGNRNDSLQHIPLAKHYDTLLGMIAYQNPEVTSFFNELNMSVTPIEIPDVLWQNQLSEEEESLSEYNYKTAFNDWLLSEDSTIAKKSISNYISGLNTLEKVWNEYNPDQKLNLWTNPYTLSIDYIFANEEVKKLNKKQNNTQSAALNYYFEFLEELKNESTVQDVNNATIVTSGINKIYFGAPGTGKSFGIKKFIQNNGIKNYEEKIDHPNVFRTTLHPEFTYNDFVGQVMPVVLNNENGEESSRIEYKFNPQVFTIALKRAFEVENTEPVFLILEEMSRANVAAVFGDLFQLLDRDYDGESEYMVNNLLISQEVWGLNSSKKIFIPKNMFIIGTVNTNDQNVFVMDTAFKRRFEFDYVNANDIARDDNNNYLNNFILELVDTEKGETYKFSWIDLYTHLNKFITAKSENGGLGLPEDKQLGQFFIKFKEDKYYNYNQIKGKLLQYLWHDIQNSSYADNRLFKESINNFSDAFTEISAKRNIFSDIFLQDLNHETISSTLMDKNIDA